MRTIEQNNYFQHTFILCAPLPLYTTVVHYIHCVSVLVLLLFKTRRCSQSAAYCYLLNLRLFASIAKRKYFDGRQQIYYSTQILSCVCRPLDRLADVSLLSLVTKHIKCTERIVYKASSHTYHPSVFHDHDRL